MIQMYPKAVVLTHHHPYGGTDMMAQSLSYALNANGYDAQIISISDATLNRLPALISDPRLALIMTTGTLPLSIQMNGKFLWQVIPTQVDYITYIIDAWPYDYVRVAPCRQYLEDWNARRNLHLVSLEANDARLMGPRKAHYMPSGAYPAPHRQGPKVHPQRLFMWASANKELAVSAVHDDFESTLADNNVWGLDGSRIARVAAALRQTTRVHGLSAIAQALEEPIESVVHPSNMQALCAIDSCLKRYRRVKVAKALRGLPVDIYGENWEQHVGDVSSFRLLKPNPDHNHAFSYICQQYAGLVNIDPNFGHGTNERAVSALAMGTPIANNFNVHTDHLQGCYPYHFSDEAIRFAAEQVLNHTGEVPLNAGHTWEYGVGKLLRSIAADSQE